MKYLPVYLNDHLAGSIGALEMVDDLIETHEGKPLEKFLKAFRDDIEADQRELKQIMEQLGIDESGTRKAGAWVAEKVLRAKLRVGDSGEANLALLQSLESLSLGIAGKRSLWRTLDVVLGSGASLRGVDFARLEKRAATQFGRVEAQRLEIARQIFTAESG
ncbi:MAG: hypothetical protein DMF37_04120 [Verrucomicrobia bacterium]|nr:MAG: hypothetical protein DMF37_04120 [Verrucomicrobiota bacterium]